jgi:ADP-ribosyl-[dinitrogen reductase] hydrolase
MTRPVKTSLTHPLIIPAVAVPGGGRVGITLCPGKRQPHAATGPWDRDLATDLDAIKTFGTDVLITLMEADELDKAAVPVKDLEAAVEARGMTWLHLPIVDFQAPSAEFEAAWRTHSPALHDVLKRGGNVVAHCRGGRGRSGLVAARLLVDLGWEPEAAITAIRSVNPKAIETPVQEAHVRGYRPAQAG